MDMKNKESEEKGKLGERRVKKIELLALALALWIFLSSPKGGDCLSPSIE